MQNNSNTYHKTFEFHHHHQHSDVSKHVHGAHILQIENLSLEYRDSTKTHALSLSSNENSEAILKNINLSVHGNEIIALLGESGSGKTSIAKAISNQLSAKNYLLTGEMYFSGENISPSENLEIQDEILYIPQGITALDPTYKYRTVNNFDSSFKDYPKNLSGGMAKSALINYAFSAKKTELKLIIADEPTDGLDSKNTLNVMEQFRAKINENTGMLLITHDIDIALEYADRIAIIKNGEIVEETSTSKFKNRELASEFAKEIFDSMPTHWNKEEMYIKNSICLFGDTGTGKTTIAKGLAGYIKCVDIPEIRNLLENEDLSSVEMVFQDPYTSFPSDIEIIRSFDNENIMYLDEFKLFGIDKHWLYKLPHQLSGGQLQRLSILKTLLQKPRILIADEATSMCDCHTQYDIFKALKIWCQQNDSILIFITHDANIKDKVASQVIYLNKSID